MTRDNKIRLIVIAIIIAFVAGALAQDVGIWDVTGQGDHP